MALVWGWWLRSHICTQGSCSVFHRKPTSVQVGETNTPSSLSLCLPCHNLVTENAADVALPDSMGVALPALPSSLKLVKLSPARDMKTETKLQTKLSTLVAQSVDVLSLAFSDEWEATTESVFTKLCTQFGTLQCASYSEGEDHTQKAVAVWSYGMAVCKRFLKLFRDFTKAQRPHRRLATDFPTLVDSMMTLLTSVAAARGMTPIAIAPRLFMYIVKYVQRAEDSDFPIPAHVVLQDLIKYTDLLATIQGIVEGRAPGGLTPSSWLRALVFNTHTDWTGNAEGSHANVIALQEIALRMEDVFTNADLYNIDGTRAIAADYSAIHTMTMATSDRNKVLATAVKQSADRLKKA